VAERTSLEEWIFEACLYLFVRHRPIQRADAMTVLQPTCYGCVNLETADRALTPPVVSCIRAAPARDHLIFNIKLDPLIQEDKRKESSLREKIMYLRTVWIILRAQRRFKPGYIFPFGLLKLNHKNSSVMFRSGTGHINSDASGIWK